MWAKLALSSGIIRSALVSAKCTQNVLLIAGNQMVYFNIIVLAGECDYSVECLLIIERF